MKTLISLPTLLLLALTVAACGKKEPAATPAPGNPVVVDPVVPTPPAPPPPPVTPTPTATEQKCYQDGGDYHAATDVCALTETVVSSEYMWNVLTGHVFPRDARGQSVFIFKNDIVAVSTTGSPNILVGSRNYGSSSFVARSNGELSFLSSGFFKPYSIKGIRITRCYGAQGYGYACPSH